MLERHSHLGCASLLAGVVVLAACSAGTGTDSGDPPPVAEPGRPPTFAAPGLYYCPDPSVPGYESEQADPIVYPPVHPEHPSIGVRPSRCFDSLDEAQRAGYRIVGPPPGFVEVGGVYLTRPPARVSKACKAAAAQVDFPPPCPTLAPHDGTWTCRPCVTDDLFALDLAASGPPGYEGMYGEPAIHLVIAASRDPAASAVSCFGGEPIEELTVRGMRARLTRCPEGSERHSGHLLLRWDQEGTSYAVSLHGRADINRKLILAVTQHLAPRHP